MRGQGRAGRPRGHLPQDDEGEAPLTAPGPDPEVGAAPAGRDAQGSVAATAPLPGAAGLVAAPEGRLSLATRLSDRLNPILVRETQQAVNGKTFLSALVLALVSIVLVALSTAGTGRSTRADGWAAFVLGMQVLTPILCLVVPLQAFLSTRHEVSGGTVEHLLLSRLTPGSIVRGKVTASVVESLVFLSVFAPLIALTYLLRGVDVPTIAVALGLAFTYSVGATVFAVAMGAVCRWPGLRALPLVIVALGLTVGTGVLTVGMREALREVTWVLRRTEVGFDRGILMLAMPVLLTAPFLFLVASSALAHPYENRSTAFRVFALVAVLATAAWLTWSYSGPIGGIGPAMRYVPRFLAVAALLSSPFWMFAATEEEALSPRVRTLVPRRALLAAAAVPFLPGGGRGLLFTLLLGACAVLAAIYFPLIAVGTYGEGDSVWLAVKAWCYVLLYASLAKLLRNLMPAGGRATALLRVGFPAVVAFLALLPAVVHLLAGLTSAATPLSGLNPFATLDAADPREGEWVVIAAPLALLLHVPSMLRGAREVAAASKARRGHAA